LENKVVSRCPWGEADEYSRAYHDTRWCKPCHDERELFKMLILEGFQAGLSWAIILKKEAAIINAFDNFDPEIIARYDEKKVEELLQIPEIIRNRLKIEAAITNAKAAIKLGSLDEYFWGFTDFRVIDNHLKKQEDMPANSPLSEKISADLKKRGFKFVGSTIIYSYLQAIGVINDHLECCDYR
jgi:DNA-3-methyladenine glycosylase I